MKALFKGVAKSEGKDGVIPEYMSIHITKKKKGKYSANITSEYYA